MKVTGRVGFLGLESRSAQTALDHVDLSEEPGVMGRADRFVESLPEYQPLARRLLGRTWLVDRLSTALRLAQSIGRGLEFVTSDGELVSADGSLIVGPRQAATGVLSRRSELRACQEQARELEQQLALHASTLSQLDRERARQEELVASSVTAYTAAASQLTECHRRTAAAAAQLDRVVETEQRLTTDLQSIDERKTNYQSKVAASVPELSMAQTRAAELKDSLEADQERITVLQQHQTELRAEVTECRIAAAKSEQRVEMLRQQMQQAQRSQHDRDNMLAEMRERVAGRERQVEEIEVALAAEQETLAELGLTKEQFAVVLKDQKAAADELRHNRQTIIERIRTERQELAAMQTQLHKQEVVTTRQRHERQTLCERMQDDYGIHLEEAATKQDHSETDASRMPRAVLRPVERETVEREIAELRDQINNIGAINLEALDELEQLEGRFAALSGQYRDLVEAKASLERITQRINADSRELFLTTVETVRGHFQELFRRLFGGGEADIIVDEAEDVLESGVEIVARPPGKEACSISLLSGGEKTLTCVALLLAVFRSKPSPFCILDEVDAALDEANIGRFTAVLKEFLSFTQFVVITHSKKTMSGADTLYGITMEESGVSKRVSVRFEDVSEDGHIMPSAIFHAKGPERPATESISDASQRCAA